MHYRSRRAADLAAPMGGALPPGRPARPQGGPDYGMPQFLPDTGGPTWRVSRKLGPVDPADDAEEAAEFDRRHRPAASGAEWMAASS